MMEFLRAINRAVEVLRLLARDLEQPEPANKRHDRHVAGQLQEVAADLHAQFAANAPAPPAPPLPPSSGAPE